MSNKVKNGDLPASEMTKREMMAMHILASIMSNSLVVDGVYSGVEEGAVCIADALLAALEKTK